MIAGAVLRKKYHPADAVAFGDHRLDGDRAG
jgi:hypothetical protein